MALMKQTITIEIVYDSKWECPPSSWDWDWDLYLDIEGGESARIVNLTTPERVDNRPI